MGEQNYQKYLEKMEVLLKEKEREVGKIRAAEKARVSLIAYQYSSYKNLRIIPSEVE